MEKARNRVTAGVWTLLATGAALLFLTGCEESGRTDAPPRRPYHITTTVGMVTDMVRQVAGERAVVQGLIGEGVDPHLYKPTRRDVALLLDADIVFYCGLRLEGKMAGTLARLSKTKPVHAVTERLDPSYLLQAAGAGHPDPHVWMDVRAWHQASANVADALAAFDPEGAEFYRANAGRYRQQLEALDAYVREVIGSIPPRQRVLITAHDAFGYFGRAYGIRVEGIQGLSTESEAGLADINRLVDLIVAHRIQAVFVETSVSDKNVRALLEGARARGWPVRIGGQLYSDAMGPPGTYEGTYLGMIDHNATVIARALGGQAPAGGWSGRLELEEETE